VSTKLESRAREMVEHAMGESWAQKKPLEELLAAAMVTLAREHAEKALVRYIDTDTDNRHGLKQIRDLYLIDIAEALRAAEEQE
jgi:hypothetical protein